MISFGLTGFIHSDSYLKTSTFNIFISNEYTPLKTLVGKKLDIETFNNFLRSDLISLFVSLSTANTNIQNLDRRITGLESIPKHKYAFRWSHYFDSTESLESLPLLSTNSAHVIKLYKCSSPDNTYDFGNGNTYNDGSFVAPIRGVYEFKSVLQYRKLKPGQTVVLALKVKYANTGKQAIIASNTQYFSKYTITSVEGDNAYTITQPFTVSVDSPVLLNPGDNVYVETVVYTYEDTATYYYQVGGDNGGTFFSGHLEAME
jgi:hypothetical protein